MSKYNMVYDEDANVFHVRDGDEVIGYIEQRENSFEIGAADDIGGLVVYREYLGFAPKVLAAAYNSVIHAHEDGWAKPDGS